MQRLTSLSRTVTPTETITITDTKNTEPAARFAPRAGSTTKLPSWLHPYQPFQIQAACKLVKSKTKTVTSTQTTTSVCTTTKTTRTTLPLSTTEKVTTVTTFTIPPDMTVSTTPITTTTAAVVTETAPAPTVYRGTEAMILQVFEGRISGASDVFFVDAGFMSTTACQTLCHNTPKCFAWFHTTFQECSLGTTNEPGDGYPGTESERCPLGITRKGQYTLRINTNSAFNVHRAGFGPCGVEDTEFTSDLPGGLPE